MQNLTELERRVLRAVDDYQASDTRVLARAVERKFLVVLAVLVDLDERGLVEVDHLGRAHLWRTTRAGRDALLRAAVLA